MSRRNLSPNTTLHHKLHEAYDLLEQKRQECDFLLCASIEREIKMIELKRQLAELRPLSNRV